MSDKARRILDMLIARDAADTLERAAGWVAISLCPEFGTTVIVGTFENPGDALAYASNWEAELNVDGDPERPYRVGVHPIFDPERTLSGVDTRARES